LQNRVETLVLVPTDFEFTRLNRLGDEEFSQFSIHADVCGFGPIASGIGAARLLNLFKPRRAILLGIAGSYSDRIAVGEAASFNQVHIEGVGAYDKGVIKRPTELGFAQIDSKHSISGEPIFESLFLGGDQKERSSILTVCAASGDTRMATERHELFPGTKAEDMESFSVAIACHQAGIPLSIIRGISNVAGDRDHSNWKINDALQQAKSKLKMLLQQQASS